MVAIMPTRNTLLSLLLSLLLVASRHGGVHAIGGVDILDNCDELVEEKRCLTHPEEMKRDCPAACRKWQEARFKVLHAYVDEDKPSFFGLSAKNSTGANLNFQQFDGYLTIVANAMKTCVPPGTTEGTLAVMEHLHDVWPYALEVLIFVFDNELLSTAASELGLLDCESHDKAVKKEGRRIHVMEEVELNGPKTHPVYKYLKEQFNLEEEDGLSTDVATFFIISPDGDKIEAHVGSSLERIKHSIHMHMEQEL